MQLLQPPTNIHKPRHQLILIQMLLTILPPPQLTRQILTITVLIN